MAKSSIHIQSGNAGFLAHNSRERATKNSIFFDEKNECSHTQKEAFKIYRNELEKRSEAYTKRTKQKLQKKAITHLSAIVNLNSNHTLKDLQPLIKHLEDTLDTKVFQVAIHRDEGHIDDNKNVKKNYHAHIEFMGLDSTGASVRKKLTKKYLSELQNKTAEILKMERGINYAKERKKRPKRLDTYDFKNVKEKEQVSRLAKQKELKLEIKRLREQLQQQHAKREDYAKLEKLNRNLKEKIKAKELTVAELKTKVADLEEQLRVVRRLRKRELEEIEKLKAEKSSYKRDIDNLKANLEAEKREIKEIQKDRKMLLQEYKDTLKETAEFYEEYKKVNKIAKEVLEDAGVDTTKEYSTVGIVNFLKKKYFQLKSKVKSMFAENQKLKEENQKLKENQPQTQQVKKRPKNFGPGMF